MLFDLMAWPSRPDITRVFTFMLNREASQLVFPNLGFNEPWHHVSHHGNEPEKLALLVKLNTWQVELFGRFLDKLKSRPDGDGTLLDHSTAAVGQRHERQQRALAARRAVPDGGQGAGAFTGRGTSRRPRARSWRHHADVGSVTVSRSNSSASAPRRSRSEECHRDH
jgi:hypothetical protein